MSKTYRAQRKRKMYGTPKYGDLNAPEKYSPRIAIPNNRLTARSATIQHTQGKETTGSMPSTGRVGENISLKKGVQVKEKGKQHDGSYQEAGQ